MHLGGIFIHWISFIVVYFFWIWIMMGVSLYLNVYLLADNFARNNRFE